MSTVEELSPDEKRAYELISSRDGLLQSELWKALDATSRKGSRLATSLEEKGLIEREQTTSNGQRTYLLRPTDRQSSSTSWSEAGPDEEGEAAGAAAGEDSADDRSTREERALELIRERGGLYQSDLWKELDVSSRAGSRIASSLEEQGAIRREEATYSGQRTYFLKPATDDLDFSLLMAGDLISPMIGAEDGIDPIESDEFTQWVLQLARDEG